MKLAMFCVVAAIILICPWMSFANPTPNDPDTFDDILKKSSHGTLLPNSQIPDVVPFPTNALDSSKRKYLKSSVINFYNQFSFPISLFANELFLKINTQKG